MNKYISFVMVGRNDTYGGNFLNRIQNSVITLNYLAKKHNLNAELIIVEYNPLDSMPRFSEILKTEKNENLEIKIITVPREFHEKIAPQIKIPVLEYIAKNIGLRRATGEYIIATNPDIVFSDEFISFIAKKELRKDLFYRANRHDLSIPEFDINKPREEVLKECPRYTARIWTSTGSEYYSWKRWLKRFIRRPTPKKLSMCPAFNPIRKWIRDKKNPIHEGAAGDFLMTHRDNWERVSGYDQRLSISFTDGYILYILKCFNIKQVILPCPIYHIFHPVGSGGRPLTDIEKYAKDKEEMLKTQKPHRPADPNWGFPEEKFNSKII